MKSLFFLLLMIYTTRGLCQELKKIPLNRSEISEGIRSKYEYNETGSYARIQLILRKNGRYVYSFNSFGRNLFSEGRWNIENNVLTLNSDITSNSVPATISYRDTLKTMNGLDIAVVLNKKGMPMTDAFVNINSDTVKCLPLSGTCIGTFNTIDSVRLAFENGFFSKWMKVEHVRQRYIYITVEVDHLLSNYVAFEEFKCRIKGNSLKPKRGAWN